MRWNEPWDSADSVEHLKPFFKFKFIRKEKNMSFKTTRDILRALADGKKVRLKGWDMDDYLEASLSGFKRKTPGMVSFVFNSPWDWELYSEPKKKVKWYRAVIKSAGDSYPFIPDALYLSEEHARQIHGNNFLTLLPDPIELEEFSKVEYPDTGKGEE